MHIKQDTLAELNVPAETSLLSLSHSAVRGFQCRHRHRLSWLRFMTTFPRLSKQILVK